VIGRDWLTCKGSKRRRRLEDHNDYVRLEIQTALEKRIRLIPILVHGAKMPGTDSLPQGISILVQKQAVEIRDTRWGRRRCRLDRFP
jgi:hypothetical protein